VKALLVYSADGHSYNKVAITNSCILVVLTNLNTDLLRPHNNARIDYNSGSENTKLIYRKDYIDGN
jgi:hypothetical protein